MLNVEADITIGRHLHEAARRAGSQVAAKATVASSRAAPTKNTSRAHTISGTSHHHGRPTATTTNPTTAPGAPYQQNGGPLLYFGGKQTLAPRIAELGQSKRLLLVSRSGERDVATTRTSGPEASRSSTVPSRRTCP